MKSVLTSREVVESKKGRWVLYKGVSSSGKTVELFLTPEEEEKYGLTEAIVAEKRSIDELFAAETIVEVNFNERGRIDSVQVTAE